MTAPDTIVPVILSGGVGTRLWPASRQHSPKQLLPLVDNRSLIQGTVDRISSVATTTTPIVVANADHADAIDAEMRLSGGEAPVLMLEPVGRNTAPAVAVAALEVLSTSEDGLMIVLPSDHTISDEGAFAAAIDHAATVARDGFLVTFGITPSRAETGYGYIRVGTRLNETASRVSVFREKPDEQMAERYLASGEYLWNSGMYLFAASRYLEELELHAPDIAAAARQAHAEATRDGTRVILDEVAFSACPSDSIDYAVMESTASAAVVPTDPGWNDVGSWASLWDIADKDDGGNVTVGDVEMVDVSNSYIRSGHRLIAAVGLEDIVIIDTPDALLVTTRDRAQDVKQIVDRLSADNRPELD